LAVLELLANKQVLERTNAREIAELTFRATGATYYADGLSADEIAYIDRVVRISAGSVDAAARNPNQHVVAAILDNVLAGFVIATAHSKDDRELDWLMVDPRFHGSGISSRLMEEGMAWLGVTRPMWLNVVRHNERAIRFYRKHGFEIDPEAVCPHAMSHWIMRRN
jgi:ribosomal protein S18 acetylase RimI-like enzyme